jgi:PleD family two-component response regulator
VGEPISDIVTVSIGVATIVPTADDDRLVFIDSVDRNLYRAKKGGRNSLVAGRRRAS